MHKQLLAVAWLLVMSAAAHAESGAWLDIALDEQGVVTEAAVAGYDSCPRPIRQKEPSYPRGELLAGKEGWVNLGFTVQPDGKPSDIRVLESSHRNFEKPVLRAIAKWRFKPKTVNGQAVATDVTQKIEFEL